MKKSFYTFVIIFLVSSMALTSCVSSKKFKASEANVDKLQKENASQSAKLKECSMQVTTLNAQIETLKNENAAVQNEMKLLSSQSKLTIAEQAKRLNDLQALIQAQRDLMNNLKNTVANALMNYKTDEITVYHKEGKVYVSLTEKLLFKSGSDVVNPKGKEALVSLAEVLKNTQDITVVIEGHTDNVPIKTSQFPDNWALSTARANSIVRILTIDGAFDPARISAAGRSQYDPEQSNETPEGRAANRRTEIILSPDLKALYTLLEQ